MSPTKLRETLKVLLDANVGEYSCGEFHVKFGPSPLAITRSEAVEISHSPKEPPKSLWHAESLWADGKPPEFQAIKKEKRG